MRIKLTYSYDGSCFCGSQSQPHGKSVEDSLNLALNHVGIFSRVITSSRTDKGVHALNQTSMVCCADFWDLARLKELINRHAHPHIHIKSIQKADDEFHARYSAKARSYRYILNHDKFSPFLSQYCYFYEKVDLKILNLVLSKFVGTHDFSEFMKVGSDIKSPVREIYKSYAFRYKNQTIIKFKSNGFLRAQVRLMVANALKATALNSPNDFCINSSITRIPAPSNGLYLERVFY
ncbi:tRNA pseudouridine(38-40) synthase TruA [Campylobacter geochelonis]|uniref:tRNA pseudouridine(38-40) synthase TruA n=1 Tax=Campylobacter geochelonis TaxID=1780362 RepID=UPI0007707AE3|nr:tRNA pseudouridine(38-40) synthase TruA [Campylobacter geochelonis]CZE50011.1 tRNA pseudouridine synthase A [Campylobacter geochelonis]